mmetsp:Transcript_30175/g.64490  ORF Transcript_30175/g.64490 Transcript_30175/m.64490 type:complete len:834 (+) Transcript_30175:278-2779(+)
MYGLPKAAKVGAGAGLAPHPFASKRVTCVRAGARGNHQQHQHQHHVASAAAELSRCLTPFSASSSSPSVAFDPLRKLQEQRRGVGASALRRRHRGGSSGSNRQAATSEEVLTSSNGATPGANGANGNGSAAVEEGAVKIDLDACEAGQLEACAQTTLAAKASANGNGAAAPTALANGTTPFAATKASATGVVDPLKPPASSGNGAEAAEQQPKANNSSDRWSRLKNTSTFKRTVEIWRFVIVFFFKLWVVNQKWNYPKSQRDKEAKRGINEEARKEKLAVLATWLRERLVTLGPTFIKIGQQFSTRSDILSPEFIAELVKLQDKVPPFSSKMAVETIEKELGVSSWKEKFSYLEEEPIAAASLGQVHRAVLLDGKTEVVIKVQRPDLKELFDVDTKNIRFVAQLLQSVDPKTDGAARDWVAIYDECCRILYQEIDYRLEGEYADSFRTNFSDLPWVKVPKVYWDLTSEKVLTLEYSPGIKVSDKAALVKNGVDPAIIARYSVECYLQQILVKGLFHADPHPGNIAVDCSDPQDPKLIFYDFGMMGKIPNNIRKGLSDFFYAVYSNDVNDAMDGLVAMGVLVPNSSADMTAIKRTGQFFLDSFKTRLREQREERKRMEADKSQPVTDYTKEDKKEKRKKILSNIGQDLLVVANDQPFRFPALFTFVVRAFSVLDGIGKQLDPRFDISEISAPYARDLLLEQRPGFSKLQDDLQKKADRQWEATKGLFVAPLKIKRVEEILESLERGDTKLRVRALEAERALQRVSLMQAATACVVAAAVSLNTATILSVVVNTAPPYVKTLCFAASALFGLMTLKNLGKLNKLNKKEKQITGMA